MRLLEDVECFDTIVISGGGLRVISYIGELHELSRRGKVDVERILNIAGTSAGSIVALLLACGMQPIEIYREVYMDPKLFVVPSGILGNPIELMKIMDRKGFMTMDGILQRVERLVVDKLGSVPTFQELYEMRGVELVVKASNITCAREIRFSRGTTPDMLTTEAIRSSCSIIGLFEPVDHEGDLLLDGAFTNNIPIDAFDDGKRRILALTAVDEAYNTSKTPMNVGSLIMRAMITSIHTITRMRCNMCGPNVTILNMSTNSGSLVDFALTKEMVSELFTDGINNIDLLLRTELINVSMRT